MADRKISDLTALTTPASGDYLPIVDISESAAASKNKRVTVQSLFQGIPVNVGIGTSSPGSLLDLRFATSPATDNGDGFNTLRVFTSSALAADTGGAISLGGTSTSGGATAAWGQIAGRKENATAQNYAGYLQFATNNDFGTMSERMRIDSSGNVGIGTSSPGFRLDVNGASRIFNNAFKGSGASAVLNFAVGGNSGELAGPVAAVSGIDRYSARSLYDGDLAFSTLGGASLTEKMRITYEGNVGIGTSSPSSLLHLADAGDITVGTTTGTKIGTSTSQKIGFFNATPVVQPTAVADATDAASVITQLNALLTRMRNLGLIAT